MPEVTPETFASRHSLGDGVLTMLTPSWVPRYTVDLQPGEAIFMPPGYIHETTNIGEECSASITHQWDSPAAARYIKSSITTIAVHEEMTGCWGKWGVYATLQSRGTFPDDLPEYESFDSVEADAEAKARAVPRTSMSTSHAGMLPCIAFFSAGKRRCAVVIPMCSLSLSLSRSLALSPVFPFFRHVLLYVPC